MFRLQARALRGWSSEPVNHTQSITAIVGAVDVAGHRWHLIVHSQSWTTNAFVLRRQHERQRLVYSRRHVWTLKRDTQTDVYTQTDTVYEAYWCNWGGGPQLPDLHVGSSSVKKWYRLTITDRVIMIGDKDDCRRLVARYYCYSRTMQRWEEGSKTSPKPVLTPKVLQKSSWTPGFRRDIQYNNMNI